MDSVVRPKQPDGGADGQGEEGEEEVDHVLARLREQHAPRRRVDEELHAQRGPRPGAAGGGGGRRRHLGDLSPVGTRNWPDRLVVLLWKGSRRSEERNCFPLDKSQHQISIHVKTNLRS
jgi:hypothetical protein